MKLKRLLVMWGVGVFIILLVAYSGTILACDVCPAGCIYSSIQAAIIDAESGNIIEVCPGTYTENIDFLGKAITVISRDGPDTTLIDGDLRGSVVTFDSGEGSDSILDGFTLIHGTGVSSRLNYGGGIYCNSSSPTIRNCCITENTAAYGAGIHLRFCDVTIDNCTITINVATRHGGGIYAAASTLTINGTLLDLNMASSFPSGKGGGIYLEDSDLDINNSSLTDNRADDFGGGLYGDGDSAVSMNNTTVAENWVNNSGGGVYLYASAPVITNSMFEGNVAALEGGGLYLNRTSGSISDSLFIRNRTNSSGAGGGIVLLMASTSITKANITENTAGIAGGGMFIYNSSSSLISDSLISLNTAGSDGAGVLVSQFSSPTFINSVFHNNFLTGVLPGFGTGGGLAIYQSSPVTLTNCTLRYNFATEQGGGLYSELSDVLLKNSIVWGNTPDQLESLGMGDTPVVTFSDIQGGYSGAGNINEIP
ncbi:MAG: right-handed parallel beta-helix repeat-containing protein [Deltaproteobacteria bacterium]|nr:right-handed parallel beta-helix repeat-containing protein [Deltaproteobacteria bacterium]